MTTSTTSRITKLDGLRGLLSVIVALNHSYLVVAIPGFANVWGQNYLILHDLQSKIQQLFMILGNGGVAVTMFFVLSGLVMGQSMSRVEFSARGLLGFFVKRILRLYPVYILILVLTAIYMKTIFTYQIFPHASTWYHWWMQFQMTFKEFIYNFFFIHAYTGGVTWTLRVILLASFVFPVFYSLTRKTGKLADMVIATALIVASFTVLNLEGFRDLRYLYMFFLGLILPKFKDVFNSVPTWIVSLFLPVGIVTMLVIRYATDEYRGGLIEALIAWIILGLIVFNAKTSVFNWLNHKIPQFFGKISYSLYLVHWSVLYLLARFMFGYFPGLPYETHYLLIHSLLFILSLSLATVISIPIFKYLETPSASLGKYLNHKISKT